ncbi:amino acid transporter heavy chain SLC3A2-like [Macrobrachium nipponense]|uniref:amino acid transporter heavy chain SLC3A2-like n=1 Tax=Macrobrachium nipponense TaxID=159736 RepID=UPI0030C7F620
MTEEKNGVKNGEATTEMAPQEDGTKVPLTNDAGPEVKFTSGADNPPNGEAKIDVGVVPTFSGLSKEDLMKYNDDPFWIRLRWFLFILFWAGWVAMLVAAIVIIVQAPRCAPKETLLWVQESAMVNYDPSEAADIDGNGETTAADVRELANGLGVTTVYLEKLISPLNFNELNVNRYNKKEIMDILEQAKKDGLHIVTDFVDIDVDPGNVWVTDGNHSDYFEPSSNRLNLTNPSLLEDLKEILRSWVGKGVQGFIISDPMNTELEKAKAFLDEALKEEVDGAVVSGVTDMQKELVSGFNAASYRQFLDEHVHDWSYFKYNPKVAEGIINELVDLVTMTLFLVRGTPVLDGFDSSYLEKEKHTIHQLSLLRQKESVQVGSMVFVNTTSDNVVAFARVLKGTPGYAVAVNMHDTNGTVVDFTSIEGVKGKGEVHISSIQNATEVDGANSEKQDLNSIYVGPLEGIILQFVPSF